MTQSVGVPLIDHRFSPISFAQRNVERERVPGGAPLLVGGDGVDVADLRQRRGQPLDALGKDPVVVGDEDPGTTQAGSSGMTIQRMM